MRLRKRARAIVRGGPLAPSISGRVDFTSVRGGTDVIVRIKGLPPYQPAIEERNPIGPHGFHIHQIGTCEICDPEDPFQKAGGHWNPDNQPHGNHAGDFPVLFSNQGMARMRFFTNKFKPEDVISRTVIIHEHPNDYRTQPDGAAGRRLACGVIRMI